MEQRFQNFISSTGYQARLALANYGELAQLNVLWTGAANYDELITQAMIDEVPSFAGLTTAQLADALYALEQMRSIMSNALPALTVLAKLP